MSRSQTSGTVQSATNGAPSRATTDDGSVPAREADTADLRSAIGAGSGAGAPSPPRLPKRTYFRADLLCLGLPP